MSRKKRQLCLGDVFVTKEFAYLSSTNVEQTGRLWIESQDNYPGLHHCAKEALLEWVYQQYKKRTVGAILNRLITLRELEHKNRITQKQKAEACLVSDVDIRYIIGKLIAVDPTCTKAYWRWFQKQEKSIGFTRSIDILWQTVCETSLKLYINDREGRNYWSYQKAELYQHLHLPWGGDKVISIPTQKEGCNV